MACAPAALEEREHADTADRPDSMAATVTSSCGRSSCGHRRSACTSFVRVDDNAAVADVYLDMQYDHLGPAGGNVDHECRIGRRPRACARARVGAPRNCVDPRSISTLLQYYCYSSVLQSV